MKRSLRLRESGFTLIEVMMAAAIFAVGSLGILAMVGTSISLNQQDRQNHEASVIASYELERLQAIAVQGASPANEFNSGTCNPGPCYLAPGVAAGELGSTTPFAAAVSPAPTITTANFLPAGEGASSINYIVQVYIQQQTGVTPPINCYEIQVTVLWPRDPRAASLASGAPGFVDCSVSSNASLCHAVNFFAYRYI